ncbi:MAG: endonuclease/exonuclease/phosphatase family protein [Butyricicoccus sp.]|nr:endonuclease/exonuclease/phosphatase family protein [Butyricicoccus sp.]
MNGLPNEERQRLGALLEHTAQDEVMAQIDQFSIADCCNFMPPPYDGTPDTVGVLVFNMERGVHLEELGDFLECCPEVHPYDVILANELDDSCVRSGQLDTTRELAARLGLNYVFGLEFIELVNQSDLKGFHGNAIFSRWPICQAKVVRLPEQYNWYFDRQHRIGGRLAILAELDIGGRHIGVGTIHLENRTDSAGRRAQLEVILQAAEEMFPDDMPVFLGGDLNTNTFDGRDKDAIQEIAGSPALQRRCLEDVFDWEACLPLAEEYGYLALPDLEHADDPVTRRKPLPGGGFLGLRLDWLLVRGAEPLDSRNLLTCREDWPFAPPGSALAAFGGQELSDHNAVWALCGLPDAEDPDEEE